MDLKRMKQAGEELNNVIQLDVPIDLDIDDKELLTLDIEEVAAMLEKGDEISSETAETIKELGFDIPKGVLIIQTQSQTFHPNFLQGLTVLPSPTQGSNKPLGVPPNPKTFKEIKKSIKAQNSKRPGIVKAILSFIDEFGPITTDEILQKLVEKFPTRKESAMKKTISAWLPNGFNKRKGLNIIKTEEGFVNNEFKKMDK